MKKFYFVLLTLLALVASGASAQLVTTSPSPLQESSKDVVLTFHADSPMGNGAMKNLPESQIVYAHIGVITDQSKNGSDWKYTVAPWPTSNGSNAQQANLAKNTLKYVAANTYTLAIGDIRTYFGVPEGETIKEIAIVFRNADGSLQCKTASGGDIYVPVLPAGFHMDFSCDSPKRVISQVTTMKFSLNATEAADLDISVNGKSVKSATNATSLAADYTFDTPGEFQVVATAKKGSEVLTDEVSIAFPGLSAAKDYPGGVPRMGTVKNADGSVTFCLAAPGKNSVLMVPSWDNYEFLGKNMMNYQDYEGARYFWTTVSGLADDQWYTYYYVVDDTYNVGDPYANLVLDPYNDRYIPSSVWPDMPKYPYEKLSGIMLAAYRGDMDDYKFSDFTIPEHDNLVIYEMLFRDFTGNDGVASGNGTVRKAIEKIPYIKSMGFNAVELMPIMEFNGNNSWGYNTNFYMAPDKAYGSPEDYKDFIEECHAQGMAVILDIVFNQSDGLHPWYQMYPIDTNPFYNKIAPHDYNVLNDWNQGNPLVQKQWDDALVYWLEKYNVDGFRFDLVKGLGDNESYKSGTEAYNQSRVDRMIRLHGVIKSVKPNGIHINEDLAGAQEETALGKDGQIQWSNVNEAACQFTMGYASGANLNLFNAKNNGNRPWGSTVSYAESHDEQRMGYKNATWGVDVVKGESATSFRRLGMLAVQMLLTPGPKMVWQFGELGNNQNTKDNNGGNNTSPKIVDWRWLDDDRRAALMRTYSAIINLRMDNPELFKETATYTASNLSASFTVQRYQMLSAGDKEVVAFINPSLDKEMTVIVKTSRLTVANSKLVACSPYDSPELKGEGNEVSVTLKPNSFAVFSTNSVVAGIDSTVAPAGDVKVYGADGRIVIVGEYSSAIVSDMSGRIMPTLDVPAGLYIVNVDGVARKVVVR